MDQLDEQILRLKALAHPIRLKIVKILVDQGELCVCKLNECVEFSQSNLSQHLKILRDAHVLKARKEGQWIYYCIKDESMIKVVKALELIK